MKPPAHQILDFAELRTQENAGFDVADTRCHMHSLLGWQWQANMSIPKAEAADHLLIHVESGSLKADIDGTPHIAKKNHCLWIPKHALRTLRAITTSTFIAAHFDIACSQHKRLSIQEFVTTTQATQTQDLKQTIARYSENAHELLQISAVFYRTLVVHMLLNNDIAFQTQRYQDGLVLASIDALEQDPTLSVDACARLQGLGVTRFRQRFHSATGMSPGNYITQFRCNRAARLLRETDQAIADISLACGYENPNYLYRVFKLQYHCTPNEFRAGLRNSV